MVFKVAGFQDKDAVRPRKSVDKTSKQDNNSRVTKNPFKLLLRKRSKKNDELAGKTDAFAPLNDLKAEDLNTTFGFSTTDSSNGATAMDLSLSSAPSGFNVSNVEDISLTMDHESFSQLDVPEMCRQEKKSELLDPVSNLVVRTSGSTPKNKHGRNVKTVRSFLENEDLVQPTRVDDFSQSSFSSKASLDMSFSLESLHTEMAAPMMLGTPKADYCRNESKFAEHPSPDPNTWLSHNNTNTRPLDCRPITEIRVPLALNRVQCRSLSCIDAPSKHEASFRDEIFTSLDEKLADPLNMSSRSQSAVIAPASSVDDFPSIHDLRVSLVKEDITFDDVTVPTSGTNTWTTARLRRTKLAKSQKQILSSQQKLESWNATLHSEKDEFPHDEALSVPACAVHKTRLHNGKEAESQQEEDSLANFPIRDEKLFALPTTASVSSASQSGAGTYFTALEGETVNPCGYLCAPFAEILPRQKECRRSDESVDSAQSDDFSDLLRREIGKKRSSAELINEMKLELMETVQELARGGSNVMKKFMKKKQ